MGVATNEGCGQGKLQESVGRDVGEGLNLAKKDPKQNVF